MARKLNKNAVGILTLLVMALLAVGGIVLLANLPGQDPEVYAAEGKKLENEHEYNRAMQTYYRAFNKDSSRNPEYLVSAARCAVEDGDIGAARQMLQQARVKNPRLRSAAELSTKLEFELGQLFGGVLQWNRVLDEAKKLAELDDQSALVHHALGSAYAQLSDQEEGYAEKAEASLKRAWEIDPTDVEIMKSLAAMRWIQARRTVLKSGSQKEFNALLEDLDSMLKTAIEKCEARGDEAAVRDLKKNRALYSILSGSDKDKEGLAALEAIADGEDKKAEVHILLGELFSGGISDRFEMDLDKAERFLKEAIQLDPKQGEAYVALGRVYKLRLEQAKEAAEDDALMKQEAAVYEKGLEAIERTKHFRSVHDNKYRTDFITELCLQQVQRARSAENTEQRDAAIKEAEGWVEKLKSEVDLDSTPVRLLTAHILNARGDYVGAIREAEAADRGLKGRRDPRLSLLLGDLYMKERQWGAARDAFQATLAQSPGAPAIYLRLGQVYIQMEQPNEALRYLKPTQPRVIAEFMDKSEVAASLRIEAYRQLGQFEAAKKEGDKLAPGSFDDGLFQARLLLLQQQYEQSESKLKELLAQRPDDLAIIRTLLQVYTSTNRMAEARAYVKELRQRDPNNREYQRIELTLAQGEGDSQQDNIKKFLEEEPDPFSRAMSLADFYARKEKYDDAVKHLDEAEQLRPENQAVIERQFRLSLLTKNWDRAEKYAIKSGHLNTDGTEGKLVQGRLALAKGEYQRAIDLMTLGLDKYPTDSMGWTYLAEAYGKAGRPSEAKGVLIRALEIDPTNGLANRDLAVIAINEGDEAATEKYLKAAARVLPNDTWIQERLRISKEKENPKEGIAVREKARQEKPDDIENLVLLARLYANAKIAEYDKAAAAYREALALAAKDSSQRSSNNDLSLAREIAGFFGGEQVNRPADGEELLEKLMKEEEDKSRKALLAVYLGQFYEDQKELARADRYFRLAVSLDASPDILTYAAEFSSKVNHLRDALEYYERVVKAAGDQQGAGKTARLRMMGLLLTMGEMDRAKEEIDAYVKAFPDDPQGMVYLGAYHRIGGDVQKAKEAFDSYLEKNPDSALALWQRGQLYSLMGRWELAITDLAKAKTFGPRAFGYQHRIALANALMESGKGADAVSELRSILDEKPDEIAVAEALVDAYSKLTPPSYADAETLIHSYAREYPKDPRWPTLLGRLGEMSRDWNKAILGYEKAAEVGRNQAEVVRALFWAYKMAGRPQEIIRYASDKVQSRTLATSPESLTYLAWAYCQGKEDEKCLETYDRALAAAGEDVMAAVRVISNMVATLGNETAMNRAKARVDADPENPDKKKVLVYVLFMNNKLEEAITICREVGKQAVRPGDSVFANLAEAMVQERLQRFPEAKASYEAALKLAPDQPMVLNNLAFLLVDKMGNPGEALPYAERARRLSPNNPNVLDTCGWTLAKNGRLGEALGVLFRASEAEKDNVSISYHIGMVYMQRGETDEARRWLTAAKQAAQDKHPDLPKINEVLQELEKAGG